MAEHLHKKILALTHRHIYIHIIYILNEAILILDTHPSLETNIYEIKYCMDKINGQICYGAIVMEDI